MNKVFTIFMVFLCFLLVGCASPEPMTIEEDTSAVPEPIVEEVEEPEPVEEVPESIVEPVEEPEPVVEVVAPTPVEEPEEDDTYTYQAPENNEPIVLKEGEFRPIQKSVQGSARWLNEHGNKTILLHAFRIDNGPKLHLYLSRHPNPSQKNELGEDFLDVGELTTYFGTQKFDLPDDLHQSQYESAVIFSEGFNVIYATAPLEKP